MDRDTFRHWHKPGDGPSELRVPPLCCASEFRHLLDTIERDHGRALDEAVGAERQRLILSVLDAVDAFGGAVTVPLRGESLELVEKVIGHVSEVIRRTACICPDIDVSRFGEAAGTSFIKGRDARCGMHESVSP